MSAKPTNRLTIFNKQLFDFKIPAHAAAKQHCAMMAKGSDRNAFDLISEIDGIDSEDMIEEMALNGLVIARVHNGKRVESYVLNEIHHGVVTPKLQSDLFQQAAANLTKDNRYEVRLAYLPLSSLTGKQREFLGLNL